MKVEWISINKIIPYARNPRRNDGLPVASVPPKMTEQVAQAVIDRWLIK